MKFQLKKSYILCSLAMLATTSSAFATEKVTMDTVIVSANRIDQDILEASNSISVVDTQKEIEKGANTIPDMLRDVPSVRVQSDGTPGVKRVSVRGESSSRTVISIDGQRLDDQKTKSGAPFLINPYFIDSIEVVKGPSSVLYGSDAIGGLVSVKTKEASDKPFEAEVGSQFSSHANAVSNYVNATGTLDRFKYALGAFYTNQNDLYLSDHRKLENTGFNAKGTNVKLEAKVTDNVSVGYANEYYDLDSQTSTTVDGAYKEYRGEIPEWKRIKHSVFVEATDVSYFVSKVKLSAYTQDNDKDFNSSISKRGPFIGTKNDQTVKGLNFQTDLDLNDYTSLILGYDGKFEEVSSDTSFAMQLGPNKNYGFNFSDHDFKQDTNALYALLNTEVTDNLTFNAGVRWNRVKSRVGKTSASNPQYAAIFKANGADQTHNKVVGSAGFVGRINDDSSLRINWSQGYRAPNIQELFLTTSTGELQQGNPNLKPEKSNNFEIGYRYDNKKGFVTDVSIFYQKSDDYIDTIRVDKPSRPTQNGGVQTYAMSDSARAGGRPQGQGNHTPKLFSFQNISEATTYGAELGFSYAMNNNFTPYVNLSFIEREYDMGKEKTKDTGIPKIQGTIGVRYDMSFGNYDVYIDPSMTFASKTKLEDINGQSHIGSYSYGGFATINLTSGVNFGSDKQYQIYASVENILDKKYQTSELIEEPGLFFVLGGAAKF